MKKILWIYTILAITGILGMIILPNTYAKTRVLFIEPGTSEMEKARMVRLAKEINQKFPDIDFQVNYIAWAELNDKLITMTMAGNPPDMTLHQDFLDLARMDMFEPIDEGLAKKPMFDVKKETFAKSALAYASHEGREYILPLQVLMWSLVGRDEMLKKVGLQLAKIKTWDDLLAASKVLTRDLDGDGQIDQWGFVYPSALARFGWRKPEVMAHSNGFYLDEVEANKKGYLELLQFIKKMQPYMPPGSITMGLKENYQAYGMGKVAMMVGATFQVANVYTIAPEALFETRAVPFPLGPSNKQYRVPLSSIGPAIFKKSPNKEAAWKILCYLGSKEKVIEYSALMNLPARLDIAAEEVGKVAAQYYPKVAEANTRIIGDFMVMQPYTVPRKKLLGGARIEREFTGIMNNFLQDKLTVEQTYEAIAKAITTIQAELKK